MKCIHMYDIEGAEGFVWFWISSSFLKAINVLTCNANNAKTIRQNMVSVMTSANCFTAFKRALIIVLRPENKKKYTYNELLDFILKNNFRLV